jgi:beta-lactamase superfamily II metal-dependent hydrolase
MKRSFIFILSLCLAVVTLTAGYNGKKARKGRTLPAWSEGYLDIHTISTGRGECLLLILPDGTSIVIDAGEFSRESKHTNVVQRPNAQTRPTKAFGDYIRHFNPNDAVDYFNLSHFHMDHMGGIEPEYTKSAEGDYLLTGVMALYHQVPFLEVIDRAYGAYDSLKVKAMSTKVLAEYKKFLEYQIAKGNLKASQFELGAVNQFALKHNAAAYPDFKIENVCSNGYVWKDGKATDVYAGIRDKIRENAASCGFVVRYGAFDFLTAGDIGDYHDLEYYVADAVGEVEAVKAHHHLSPHSMCQKSVEVLKPQVMVATSFYNRDIQPDKSKFDYISKLGCRLYCTSVGEKQLAADAKAYEGCAAVSGHIVIRVAPKGDSYMVYTLDDMDSKYRVKKIDGPFKCK